VEQPTPDFNSVRNIRQDVEQPTPDFNLVWFWDAYIKNI